jgi:phage terminase small subunit
MPGNSSLTIKQERFAQKYVQLGSASEAYRQSYDASSNGPETVHNDAHVLLKTMRLAARVSVLEELALKRHEITVGRIFTEYSKLGFQDTRKAFDEDGSMKPLHEIDGDTSAAIAGFEIEETYLGTGRLSRGLALGTRFCNAHIRHTDVYVTPRRLERISGSRGGDH